MANEEDKVISKPLSFDLSNAKCEIDIKETTGKIRGVRGRGLMFGIDLEDDGTAAFATRVREELLIQGFVIAQRPATNTLRIDPALTIPQADLERFTEVFENVLKTC